LVSGPCDEVVGMGRRGGLTRLRTASIVRRRWQRTAANEWERWTSRSGEKEWARLRVM
jgi:hypothetical protein